MMRRLKQDIDFKIPPKKEILIKVPLNKMQKKMYSEILLDHQINGLSSSKMRNVIMQLRKVCIHPYLFEGVEKEGELTHGEHLIQTSSKLKMLDLLLKKLY